MGVTMAPKELVLRTVGTWGWGKVPGFGKTLR